MVKRSSIPEADEDIQSDCPSFKKHWDPKDEACIQCAKQFQVEYEACRKACTADRGSGADDAVATAVAEPESNSGSGPDSEFVPGLPSENMEELADMVVERVFKRLSDILHNAV